MEALNGHAYRFRELHHVVDRPLLWRHVQPLIIGYLNIPNINNRDGHCAKPKCTEILHHHCSSHVSIAEPGAPYGLSDSSSSCSTPRSSAIAANCASAAWRSCTISTASTSGSGRLALSSKVLSRSQKMSRLTLSRASSSSYV